MKLTKIMSGALAGAMALSMSVTAFAAGETEQATTLDLAGETATATIKVSLPSTPGKMVLNPYGLKVVVGTGKAGASDSDTVTDQIAAIDQVLTNLSDTDIKVGITGTATPASADTKNAVTLATAPVVNEGAKAETKKSVFLYFEAVAADADDADVTWTTYDAADKDIKNKVTVLSTKAATAAKTVDLAKSEDGTDAADKNGYAIIHLDGNAATSPTVAWASGDTVAVNFTFTFTPTVLSTATT